MNSTVIKTPEAIEHLGIPQIGILPKVENIKKGYHILQNFLEDSESNFSEAIRSSRTIIEAKFKKNKSFLITSSNPSEGKTSYAFNLALSLEKNNKVLFVEADIRRPSVLNSFYKFDQEINVKIISPNFSLKDYNTQSEEFQIKKLIKISDPEKDKKTLFIWPEGIFYQSYLEDSFKSFKNLFDHFLTSINL